MKYFHYAYALAAFVLLGACQDGEEAQEFTARELSYPLASASTDYDIQGVATFRERANGELQLTLKLENTIGGGQHPGHLHYGTTDVPDSEVALLLTPVEGADGTSVTTFSRLADGTSLSFDDLRTFNGSLKVHLDDGPNKGIVLAGANIGQNSSLAATDIAVCSSSSDQ